MKNSLSALLALNTRACGKEFIKQRAEPSQQNKERVSCEGFGTCFGANDSTDLERLLHFENYEADKPAMRKASAKGESKMWVEGEPGKQSLENFVIASASPSKKQ